MTRNSKITADYIWETHIGSRMRKKDFRKLKKLLKKYGITGRRVKNRPDPVKRPQLSPSVRPKTESSAKFELAGINAREIATEITRMIALQLRQQRENLAAKTATKAMQDAINHKRKAEKERAEIEDDLALRILRRARALEEPGYSRDPDGSYSKENVEEELARASVAAAKVRADVGHLKWREQQAKEKMRTEQPRPKDGPTPPDQATRELEGI